MHLDSMTPVLVATVLGILLIGLISKLLKQPNVVGYLLAGVAIGPHAFGFVTDVTLLERMGSLGVLLLLFFVGMEITPKKLVASWRIAVIGTLVQIVLSVSFVWIIAQIMDWSFAQAILLGFLISLSSTAVIIKLLDDRGMLGEKLGQDILSILLAQDLAIIPMLLIIGSLTGENMSTAEVVTQIIGGIGIAATISFVIWRGTIHLPFASAIEDDHELQVFAALGLCFGLATVTGLMNLSGALGAFAAGIIVSAARETEWVKDSLESMRALFMGFFFVSIGMLIDLSFLVDHVLEVFLLVAIAFATNTVINASILKVSGYEWREAIYGASYLSQIGEFSFVFAAVGLASGLLDGDGYRLAVIVIAITLLLSPMLIGITGRRLRVDRASRANDTAITQPGDLPG